jgi:rod shape determining protein RodA
MATLTRVRVEPAVEGRANRPDYVLLSAVVALSGFGLLMIYSATRYVLERSDLPPSFSMERQMVFVTIGLIAMLLLSRVDYREYRNYLPIIYGITLLLLVVVFAFPPVNGARRWIPLPLFQFQPAEFAKLVVIVAAAQVLASNEEGTRLPWATLLRSGVLVGVPFILIFLEPDLGTTMVLPFVWAAMLFAAGAGWRQLGSLFVLGAVGTFTVFRLGILKGHQMDRIRVFLDPNIDPQGIGYQLRQSKLAIGSGQLFGKGLFQGTQTNLSYVPEQETDFIFTAVGEQLGLVGGLLVLAAFLVIVWRLMVIAVSARDRFGSLIAVGIAALIMFHTFVNIGMTMGIAPVTGLPLPFLSQGGSFYVAMAMGIGIANSIWLRRSPVPGVVRSG